VVAKNIRSQWSQERYWRDWSGEQGEGIENNTFGIMKSTAPNMLKVDPKELAIG